MSPRRKSPTTTAHPGRVATTRRSRTTTAGTESCTSPRDLRPQSGFQPQEVNWQVANVSLATFPIHGGENEDAQKWFLAIAALLVLALVAAGPASAADKNHDKIPDRWEKRHNLSLKVNQAKRDQDRDQLNNRGEFRSGSDPRDDDTDDDGVEDGDENAGTVASFDGTTLTINLLNGGTITGNGRREHRGQMRRRVRPRRRQLRTERQLRPGIARRPARPWRRR